MLNVENLKYPWLKFPGDPEIFAAGRWVLRFVLLSLFWILISDYLVRVIEARSNLGDLTYLQTIKALLYVALTGGFLFTEIHKYQITLNRKSAENQKFLKFCRTPMFIVSRKSLKILHVNPAAGEKYQYFPADIIGTEMQLLQEETLEPQEWGTQCVHHIIKGRQRISVTICWSRVTWNDSQAFLIQVLSGGEDSSHVADGREQFAQELWIKKEKTFVREIERLNQKIEALTFDIRNKDFVNNELIEVNEKLQQANKRFAEKTSAVIQQKEENLIHIIESLNDVVWCFDFKKSQFDYLSKSAEGIYELPYHELLRKHWLWEEFLHPDDHEIRKRFNEVLFREGRAECNYRIVTEQGTIRWLFDRMKIEYDKNGDLSKLKGVTADITFVKQSEEIIRQNKLNLDSVFDNIQEQFIILDCDGRIMSFNRMAELQPYLFERRLESGEPFLSFLSPARQLIFARRFDQITTYKESIQEEIQFRIASGETFWYSFSLIPVLGENNELQQICFKGVDVTSQKRIEQAIRISKENLDALINNTPDALWSVDVDGRIMTMNAEFCAFIREETDAIILVGDNFPKVSLFNERWINGFHLGFKGKKISITGSYKNRKGETRFYEASLNPIVEENLVIGVAGLYRDVTQNKVTLRKSIETNRRNKMLARASNEAIWEWNSSKDRITWNRGINSIFGLKPGNITNFSQMKDHVHPDDSERIYQELDTMANSLSDQWSGQFRFRCFDGSYKYILGRAYVHYTNGVVDYVVGSMQDLSSLVLAEKAIRISNERYKLASRATGDTIYDHDLKMDEITWSESYTSSYGYPSLKEDGDLWLNRIHPDDLTKVHQSWRAIMSNPENNTWREEYRFRKQCGTYAFVLDRGFLVRDEEGSPSRIIGAMVDLTDKMNAIGEIQKLSMVASKTNNMVLICDRKFCIEWVNDALLKNTRLDISHVINRGIQDFFLSLSADAALVDKLLERIGHGLPFREELCLSSGNGKELWVRIDAAPNQGRSGEVEQFILILSDITEQKEYEDKIINIAREFSTLIEHANAVIFGIDRNGYVNEWNGVSAYVTGFCRNEVLGRKILDYIRNDDASKETGKMLNNVLKGQAISNFELAFQGKTGRNTILLLNATPRKNTSGAIVGALIVGQDITELIEYRTDLERKVKERTDKLNKALKNEIEVANMKKRFVSVASHEFRTPLSTINFSAGYIRRYRKKIGDAEIEQKLRTIEQQVKQMNFLLEDVLTLERNDSNKIKVNYVPVDLQAFLPALIGEVKGAYANTHVVHIVWKSSGNVLLISDVNLLRHIFVNLLGNAIKFSPDHKEVQFCVEEKEHDVVFTVADRGIGICADDMAKIFEAFHRGENASAIQGTGLGLNIVKHAAGLLGGEILVTSEPGKGSTFLVKIPKYNEKAIAAD